MELDAPGGRIVKRKDILANDDAQAVKFGAQVVGQTSQRGGVTFGELVELGSLAESPFGPCRVENGHVVGQ